MEEGVRLAGERLEKAFVQGADFGSFESACGEGGLDAVVFDCGLLVEGIEDGWVFFECLADVVP